MLVYVSGPYSPGHGRSTEDNIIAARKVAIALWEDGHAVICPHLNTAHFEDDCKATYDDYISGDLEMVRRCDGIVMISNWDQSKGAHLEHLEAAFTKKKIYYWPDKPSPELRCS